MKNGITHQNLGTNNLESLANKIEELKEVYICFDFTCNLHCPHCSLQNIRIKKDLTKIRKTIDFLIQKNPEITFNFFGGEPLLLQDKDLYIFKDLFNRKGTVVSTNLLRLTDYQINLFDGVEDINTSWNPKRFSDNEFHTWLMNIEKLKENLIPYSIMITLTQDLLELDQKDFLDMVEQWTPRNLDLKFMVGDYTMDFDKVDNWLVNLYKIYQNNYYSFRCLLFKELEDVVKGNKIWKQYCPTIATIYPNGNLKLGCPYYEYKVDRSNCIFCEYYPVCKGGCDIQEKCSFPKKLYEEIKRCHNY